jgi:hypothetical protein
MINKIKIIISIIFLGIFILIGLSSLYVIPISIDDYVLVKSTDKNGQKNNIILTPENEMIYIKDYKEIVEVGIYKLKGQKARHFLFGLYCNGLFPLGLRYYNNAEMVFNSTLKLIKKDGASFPEIGETFNSKFIIFSDKAIIGNETYKRIILTETVKEELIQQITKIKSSIK